MPEVKFKEFPRVRVLSDSRGQGLVEYALLLVLITMVVFAMVVIFGQHLGNTYELVNSSVPDVGK